MLAIAKSVLILLCLSSSLEAATRTVAVYTTALPELPARSIEVFQAELQLAFDAADIRIELKNPKQASVGDNYESVAVGRFDGSCSVSNLLPETRTDVGSLGDTLITNGKVLPYFRVDCRRLVRMLNPALLHARNQRAREELLGRALARVVAHEIYHIVLRTQTHPAEGIAKSEFSVDDLTAARLDFAPESLVALNPALAFTPPQTVALHTTGN